MKRVIILHVESPQNHQISLASVSLLPFLPYVLVSIAHIGLDLVARPEWLPSFVTKQLLMPTLALAVLCVAKTLHPLPKRALVLLGIALTFSWIGDGAGLFFPELPTLLVMIFFFGCAHVAYIVLFWCAPMLSQVGAVAKWALVYLVWWVLALLVVGPHAGLLFIPLAVYGIVLGATAALSTRLGKTVATGGAFFLISDTGIALTEFMEMPQFVTDLIMPTYVIGQGLIVFGVLALLRESQKARVSQNVQPG